jgi:hypothetical protein
MRNELITSRNQNISRINNNTETLDVVYISAKKTVKSIVFLAPCTDSKGKYSAYAVLQLAYAFGLEAEEPICLDSHFHYMANFYSKWSVIVRGHAETIQEFVQETQNIVKTPGKGQ